MHLVTDATRQRLREYHPGAIAEIDRLEHVLDDTSLDPDLLALCARYFDTTLRGGSWSPPEPLSELESSVLNVCEQFMLSVSAISDEQVAALNARLSADDVYNLMSAIYLIEMSTRLNITLERFSS